MLTYQLSLLFLGAESAPQILFTYYETLYVLISGKKNSVPKFRTYSEILYLLHLIFILFLYFYILFHS